MNKIKLAVIFLRLWAKLVDFSVTGVLFLLALNIFHGSMDSFNPPWLLNILFCGFWLLILEPAMIAMTGTTLGKWLLNIKITGESGGKQNYGQALFRGLLLSVFGLGFGVSWWLLIALVIANILFILKYQATVWDEYARTLVVHSSLGKLKITFAIILVAPFVYGAYLSLWQSTATMLPLGIKIKPREQTITTPESGYILKNGKYEREH